MHATFPLQAERLWSLTQKIQLSFFPFVFFFFTSGGGVPKVWLRMPSAFLPRSHQVSSKSIKVLSITIYHWSNLKVKRWYKMKAWSLSYKEGHKTTVTHKQKRSIWTYRWSTASLCFLILLDIFLVIHIESLLRKRLVSPLRDAMP